jgi:hypothetical protein
LPRDLSGTAPGAAPSRSDGREDLEPPAGPSLSDLPAMLFDDEIARVAEDLDRVAELEGR